MELPATPKTVSKAIDDSAQWAAVTYVQANIETARFDIAMSLGIEPARLISDRGYTAG